MSFQVEKGESRILGPNGAGKHTMRICTGYMPARPALFAWMGMSVENPMMSAPDRLLPENPPLILK